jgi:hypothetical protein
MKVHEQLLLIKIEKTLFVLKTEMSILNIIFTRLLIQKFYFFKLDKV